MTKMANLKQNILTDLKVELSDEFDQNFTRKAFFDKPWPKRIKSGKGSLMIVSGRGRRSIRGEVIASGVRWSSDTDYMGIHNRGGKIKVTPRMRRFFWAQYYKNAGQITYAVKTRKAADSQRNRRLNDEAQFWRNMALTKKEAIEIPQRQVIGNHRRVQEVIREVANRNLLEYMEKLGRTLKK